MKKILVISATNDNNLALAKELNELLSKIGVSSEMVCLEDLKLPLYNIESTPQEDVVESLVEKMNQSAGFIFCAPEYNGGVPPILSNAIAWITVKSEDWRYVFNGKFALIGTHSGGDGHRFLNAFRSQLEYMGTNVLARTISVTKEKPLEYESAERILQGLVDIVN